MGWLRRKIARAFRHKAVQIEGENRGPHAPGTLGAEWYRWAQCLRELASQIEGRT